jgi:hypothetical protein
MLKKKKTDYKNKSVVTIIFDGKLWSCKQDYRYESLKRTPIWEYPKIGPWFEIMTSVDADLKSGRRFQTGRRSESIIYIYNCFRRHRYKYFWFMAPIKDLYSRKDSNLVFSRFISCGEVLCYNRAKINSFILKCLENS